MWYGAFYFEVHKTLTIMVAMFQKNNRSLSSLSSANTCGQALQTLSGRKRIQELCMTCACVCVRTCVSVYVSARARVLACTCVCVLYSCSVNLDFCVYFLKRCIQACVYHTCSFILAHSCVHVKVMTFYKVKWKIK